MLNPLAFLSDMQLKTWMQDARAQAIQGQVARRIPLLAKTDPHWLAVAILTNAGVIHQAGDDYAFPLMSAIKPFVLLYLLEHYGVETVFAWVGMEPSEAPFNSLEQLMADRGRPRNPMINSGAIALTDRLPGDNGRDRCDRLCQWLNQQAGCQLQLDELMLTSVRSAGREPNQALIRRLTESGYVKAPEIALDTYEQICCLSGQVKDLAQLGQLLAFDHPTLASQHRRIVNALMLTCGLYEASPTYAVKIGLPMKSGISGALLAVIPQQGTIACYSPALDRVGNPVAGLVLVEKLTQALQLSVFE